MTTTRFSGVVDWYNAERGFGVIIGDDRVDYFVHFTNLPTGLTPTPGQRLTFQARPRRGKAGMEAFEVATVQSARHSPPSPADRAANAVAATRAAAAEALALQRQRKKGLAPPRVEPFPPGTRVTHPRYGSGIVVLAAPGIISVRFSHDPSAILDVPRSELQTVVSQPSASVAAPPTTIMREAPAPRRVDTVHGIAAVAQQLARDAQIALTQDGLDAKGIYLIKEEEASAVPPLPLTLAPPVAQAFAEAQGITSFYSHQAETRERRHCDADSQREDRVLQSDHPRDSPRVSSRDCALRATSGRPGVRSNRPSEPAQ
jgi:CspA family cold shock protein